MWLVLVVGLLAAAHFISAVATSNYTTIKSEFSDDAIRFKSWAASDENLCRGGTDHHAGWVDLDSQHLFFCQLASLTYFSTEETDWLSSTGYHEAHHDPLLAPLLIWVQNSPGESVLTSMLFENGPCLLDDTPDTTRSNPLSWTKHFNVVYLEQFPGAGLSYAKEDDDEKPSYTYRVSQSSLDTVRFIRLLYQAFPSLVEVDLHLAGEAFGGRSATDLASTILDYNKFLTSHPKPSEKDFRLPLRGLILGNPWISPVTQVPSMYDVSCFEWRGEYPPHLDQDDCVRVLAALERCETRLRTCGLSDSDPVLCQFPREACEKPYLEVFRNSTGSMQDRRIRSCQAPGNCYPEMEDAKSYLNSVRVFEEELEVNTQTSGAKKRWDRFNASTYARYMASGDYFDPTTPSLSKILDAARGHSRYAGSQRQLDVLIYAGVADITSNPDGLLDTMKQLRWPGQAPFRGTPWADLPWLTQSGGFAGRLKAVPNLWFVEMEEAGQMVSFHCFCTLSISLQDGLLIVDRCRLISRFQC